MEPISRYGKFIAQPGKGAELAEILLRVAEGQRDDDGCLLYLVNQQSDDPDAVWVTELWRSQNDLDVSLAQLGDNPEVANVLTLVKQSRVIELDLRGGKGPVS